jgi:hypothetical protein
MKVYTIHVQPSGEIEATGYGDIEAIISDESKIVVDRVADPKTEYWNGTELTPRPTNLATINKTTCIADGIDTVTIQGAEGKLFLDGIEYPIIDPEIYLTFEDTGTRYVRIRNFPMQDFEAIINAN